MDNVMKVKILENIKKLQDLKFEIYDRSFHKIDFHDFGVLNLKSSNKDIHLDEIYNTYKDEYSLSEIADIVIKRYEL